MDNTRKYQKDVLLGLGVGVGRTKDLRLRYLEAGLTPHDSLFKGVNTGNAKEFMQQVNTLKETFKGAIRFIMFDLQYSSAMPEDIIYIGFKEKDKPDISKLIQTTGDNICWAEEKIF
jgi:hypothetical protein